MSRTPYNHQQMNMNNKFNNMYQMGNNMSQTNIPNNNNVNTNEQNQVPYSELMKYANYYNPLIIQNYYAMFSQMNYMNQGGMANGQFTSYFASPYTMNNNRPQQPHQVVDNRPKYFNNSYNYKPNIEKKQYSSNPEQDEEIKKWVESRKRNFPTKVKIEEKNTVGKIRENAGILSKLELKLREKVKILTQINKKGNRNNNNRNRRRHKQRRRKDKRDYDGKPLQDEEAEDGEIVEPRPENIENNNQPKRSYKPEESGAKDKNKPKQRKFFRYRKNRLHEELIKSDKFKEMNIILQAFRYFVNENLV
jgi:hypothetical protein